MPPTGAAARAPLCILQTVNVALGPAPAALTRAGERGAAMFALPPAPITTIRIPPIASPSDSDRPSRGLFYE